jgi:hyperosmotically inducible periplasmic protein
MRIVVLICLMVLSILTHATSFEKIGQEIDDSVITTKIKAEYTKESLLNPFKISVTTNKGIVHLDGYVDNKKAYAKAIDIATNTHGVDKVDAKKLLIKKVNTRLTDAYITTKAEATILKTKIAKDESIPLVGIKVTTKNGVITLTGKVKKASSIDTLINAIKKINGVKQVISKIEVNSL